MTKEFDAYLEKENAVFNKTTESADRQTADSIINVAGVINKVLSSLSENNGTAGFALSISKRGTYPVKSVEIGQIKNPDNSKLLANLNTATLRNHPEAISSGEGAISVKDWVISVYGFDKLKMNTAVALGIAFGANLITYQEAENMARDPRINCVSEYMEHEEVITEPFLSKIQDTPLNY